MRYKSIGVLKITYGNLPWGQERPPGIRKAISGTFLIHYFLHIYISVVCQIVCIFQEKSNGEDENNGDDDKISNVFLEILTIF